MISIPSVRVVSVGFLMMVAALCLRAERVSISVSQEANPAWSNPGVYITADRIEGILRENQTTEIELNVNDPYVLNVQARNVVSYTLSFRASPAYELVIDKVRRKDLTKPGVHEWQTAPATKDETVTVTLVRRGASGPGNSQPLGEASSLSWDAPIAHPTRTADPKLPKQWPHFKFNMGSGRNGEPLPPLQIPMIARNSSTDEFIPPQSDEFVFTSGSGGGFELSSPQVKATIDPVAGSATGDFDVKFTVPGANQAFLSYRFAFSSGGIQCVVTKTLTGSSHTYETSVSGVFGINSITSLDVVDWHKTGGSVQREISLTRTLQNDTVTGYPYYNWFESGRFIDIETLREGSTVASKTRREYRLWQWVSEDINEPIQYAINLGNVTEGYQNGDYLTEQRTDPGAPEVTRTKSPVGRVTLADSGTLTISLAGGGTTTARGRKVHETWLDVSPSITGASVDVSNLKLTQTIFDEDSKWEEFEWPKQIDSFVGGNALEKSSITYAQSTLNGSDFVTATRNDYVTNSGSSLQTITKTYRPDVADPTLRKRPVSVTQPNQTKVSYAYERGTYTGSGGFSVASSGDDMRISVLNGTASGGDSVTSVNGISIDAIGLHSMRSTKVVKYLQRGRPVREETYVYTGSGAFALLSWEESSYTVDGRLAGRQTSRGASYSATWVGTRKMSESDETGLLREFTYDDADRVKTVTRQAVGDLPALRTEYVYDAANRVVATRVGPSGSEIVTTRVYDHGGRLRQETAPGGLTTHYTYQDGGRVVTETYAQGTADEAAKTIVHYRDGRVANVTGSAVVPEYFTYDFDSEGLPRMVAAKGTSTGRPKTVVYDLLGRVRTESSPGFGDNGDANPIVTSNQYNSLGQLVGVTTEQVSGSSSLALLAPKVLEYDALGAMTASGLNVDGVAGLQNAGTDRFDRTETQIVQNGSAFWLETKAKRYIDAAGNYDEAKTYALLSAGGGGLLTQVDSYDYFNNRTTTVTTFDPGTKSRIERVHSPDGTVAIRRTVDGLVVSEKLFDDATDYASGAARQTTSYTYDAWGRLLSSLDPRGNATRHDYYPGTTRIQHTFSGRDLANAEIRVASFTYDGLGRIASVTDAKNVAATTTYYPNGLVKDQAGPGSYPTHSVYDAFGQRTELWTYRNGAGGTPDKTFWLFDPNTGWLRRKEDAIGKGTTFDYTYSGSYKNVIRHSARSGVSSTTKYLLTTGDLARVEYSDSTPQVTYSYWRNGLVKEVSDATGLRDFEYNRGRLSAEGLDATWYGGLVLTTRYQDTAVANPANNRVPGRYEGFSLGYATSNVADLAREMQVVFAYDDLGRIEGLTASYAAQGARPALSVPFSYSYHANTNIWSAVASGNFSVNRTLEPGRDIVSGVTNQWGSTVLAGFAYTTNHAGERETRVQTGTLFADYGDGTYTRFQHNDRGELTEAATYLGTNTGSSAQPLPGRDLGYDYDTAGNRRTVSVDAESVNYRSEVNGSGDLGGNALNQVRSRGTLKSRVSGTARADAAVTVNSLATSRQGRYWDVALPGFSSYAQATVTATASSGSASAVPLVLSRPVTESFVYDDDGNLTDDSLWKYEWDAENRLKRISTQLAAVAWGAPDRVLEFKYDYLGRRVEKIAWLNGVVTRSVRFVYEGWNLIAEVGVASGIATVNRSYVWGLDVAGSLTEAGGVGALLLQTTHDAEYVTRTVGYDDNGNVVALLDVAGTARSLYEYDPYGQFLRQEGDEAGDSPFGFSTKYTDFEAGIIYYGLRYYDPSLGRFFNRDPVGEKGGDNLYAFVANAPIAAWDYLGLEGSPQDKLKPPPEEPTVVLPTVVVESTRTERDVFWDRYLEESREEYNEYLEGQWVNSVHTMEIGRYRERAPSPSSEQIWKDVASGRVTILDLPLMDPKTRALYLAEMEAHSRMLKNIETNYQGLRITVDAALVIPGAFRLLASKFIGLFAAENVAVSATARGASSYEAFLSTRTFASHAEAQRAWSAYRMAASAEKGLVIGHGEAPINAAYNGWQALRMPQAQWTPGVNMAWIDGAVEAGLPVRVVGPVSRVGATGDLTVTWQEILRVIGTGGKLQY